MSSAEDYFVCPHCGAEVKARARACPECGSDATTGWSEDADKWAADIPTGYSKDDEFDYDGFIKREFGSGGPGRGLAWRWMVVLVLALAALWVLRVLLSFLWR